MNDPPSMQSEIADGFRAPCYCVITIYGSIICRELLGIISIKHDNPIPRPEMKITIKSFLAQSLLSKPQGYLMNIF